MQQEPLVLLFSELRAADLPLVGGKGANLGELTHLGLPVPPGFCLTTVAFQQFMGTCPQSADLYALLETVKADDVEKARIVGQQIRRTLLNLPVPPEIALAVEDAWHQVGADHAYALRSSATAEDLPGASFAGQQDTYLNIRGEIEIMDAVRRCWVSLFTDRAILYRVQNGFAHQDVLLSVAVQQMIMSEMSGILFTADPLTGHRHTTAIDASFGLGEALVSGIVSPDAYRVDKRTRTIIDRQIADKLTAIFPEKDGGTRQEELPEEQRSRTVLTDTHILALADMGAQVEAHYGSPQDIEWAIADGEIHLLQARPITSLYPIDGLRSPDDSLHNYFSMGHQQNMTNAMSPLGISAMRCIIPLGRTQNAVESNYLRANGGRIFIDLTLPLRHPILRRTVLGGLSQLDTLAPESLQLAMARPEFQRPNRISFSLSSLRGSLRMVYRFQRALWRQDLTGFVHQVDELIEEEVRGATIKIERAPAGEAKIQALVDVIQSMHRVVLNWAPQLIAGVIAQRLLMRLGRGWADPVDLDAYTLGLPGNVVIEMNLAVDQLADIARRSPALTALFGQLGDDSRAWLAEAAQIEDSGPFFQAWEEFLTRYGARGSGEIDIATPSWYEEPLPLLKVVASHMQQEVGSHRVQQQTLARKREVAVNCLIAEANHGPFGRLRARLTRRLIHVSQEGSILREHHKYMAVQILRVAKEAIKKTAAFLTDAQKLTRPNDIWYLSLTELLILNRQDKCDAVDEIPARRADLIRFQKMTPPLVITSDGETPVIRYQVADAPPGALLGSPVSGGIVEGTVHVIHDPQTETLAPGEILAAPFTDPRLDTALYQCWRTDHGSRRQTDAWFRRRAGIRYSCRCWRTRGDKEVADWPTGAC